MRFVYDGGSDRPVAVQLRGVSFVKGHPVEVDGTDLVLLATLVKSPFFTESLAKKKRGRPRKKPTTVEAVEDVDMDGSGDAKPSP